MNVSVLVCTYGSREWARRGVETAKRAVPPGAAEVIAFHFDDGTLAQARNTAAAGASGDWLCFLDADDSLDPGYLEAMAGMGAGGFPSQWPHWLDPSPLLVPAISFVGPGGCTHPTIPAWDRSIYDVNCAVIGTLISRSLFASVGGFGEWDAYEDWELWLRCIAAGAKLVPVPGAVYCARAEDGTGRNTGGDHSATYDAIRERHAGVGPRVWEAAKL